ncbi:flagellar hook-length control protein FliK [Leeia oryzae]|uniref:flagellar hook-length control protein FliK n=1 Tax=Leeia oryzae TaxID=356662 RepID=UPI0003A56C45|nr:flagellar hook-length control protein FliK [Leeia oryzae]
MFVITATHVNLKAPAPAANAASAASSQTASGFSQLLKGALPKGADDQSLSQFLNAAGLLGGAKADAMIKLKVTTDSAATKDDQALNADASFQQLAAALLASMHLTPQATVPADETTSGTDTPPALDVTTAVPANDAAVLASAADVADQDGTGAAGDDPAANDESFRTQLMFHMHEKMIDTPNQPEAQKIMVNAKVSYHDSVDVPVHEKGWADAMSQRVVLMAGKDIQNAELQLNPPNLGPVSVKLNIQNQEASISFTSPHIAVREAIQSAAPRLIEMFAGSGLSLTNVNVGSDRQQASQQQEKSNGRKVGIVAGMGANGRVTEGIGASDVSNVVVARHGKSLDGLAVDTFV